MNKQQSKHIDPRTGIWNLEQAKTHFFDESLAAAIMKEIGVIPPRNVADLGCGKGNYCAYFKKHGWTNIDAYEGTPDIELISAYKPIKQIDLSKEAIIHFRYDFVLCLEVGEHIPKEKEDIFIANLNKWTRNIIVLSWAIEGQAGNGHVNCRNNSYILDKMSEYGFTGDMLISARLREASTLAWFKNTLMWLER
jgi:2-polyprenyl-3-methyl-5-hydroxy-6-metoxy-1,4-benzoquinol methylase